MLDANREYLTNRVLSASPMELIRMLYEGALDAVRNAIDHLHSGDIMERGHAITKACAIIDELQASLQPVPGDNYSIRLEGLYGYMRRELLKAHMQQAENPLHEVSGLLSSLLEGWTLAITGSEPVAAPRPAAYLGGQPAIAEGPRSWSF